MSRGYALAKQVKKISGSNVTDAWWLEILAVGKKVNAPGWQQWVAANEYISATLGSLIGLPVPPFVMLEKRTGGRQESLWFASLDYRLAGEQMPPVDPDEVFEHVPDVCAGVIALDLWIANTDRHENNLSFEPTTKRLNVFDHSHSLFGIEGGGRLTRLADSFTLTEVAESGANRHCLIDKLDDLGRLDNWLGRIEKLPNFQIVDACTHALDLGIIESGERQIAIDFLLRRRRLLRELFHANSRVFPSLVSMPMIL